MLVKGLCTVPGCNQEIYAKGICRRHYTLDWQRRNKKKTKRWHKMTGATRAVMNFVSRLISRYEGNPYAQRDVLEFHKKNLTKGEYGRLKRKWTL